MPEADRLLFELRELAEILVKHQGIREGYWGVYIEFGLGAANVPTGPGQVTPAAINFLQKIGIQKFAEPNNLTVDASQLGESQVSQKAPAKGSALVKAVKAAKAARKK
jgi:hypothetical protein